MYALVVETYAHSCLSRAKVSQKRNKEKRVKGSVETEKKVAGWNCGKLEKVILAHQMECFLNPLDSGMPKLRM